MIYPISINIVTVIIYYRKLCNLLSIDNVAFQEWHIKCWGRHYAIRLVKCWIWSWSQYQSYTHSFFSAISADFSLSVLRIALFFCSLSHFHLLALFIIFFINFIRDLPIILVVNFVKLPLDFVIKFLCVSVFFP
jgi:hypothetical protein